MSTEFTVITEELDGDLEAIRLLVTTFASPTSAAPKTRVAASNSAVLLLAATFEEFVREMALTFAKAMVAATTSFEKLPKKMAPRVWLRTLDTLARTSINAGTRDEILAAQDQFSAAYKFCTGDLSQDIYNKLIYNEHHMRLGEINKLFGVSGLPEVCKMAASEQPLCVIFDEDEKNKVNGMLDRYLREFFKRRNTIAHSLNANQSIGADQVFKDIDMFSAFASALCETLEVWVATNIGPASHATVAAPGSSGTTRNLSVSPL